MEALVYLRNNSCSWDNGFDLRAENRYHLESFSWILADGGSWIECISCCAAFYNQLEVLKYIKRKYGKCGWRTCSLAAKGGHLEIMKWGRDNGCFWEQDAYATFAKINTNDILHYIKGNLDPFYGICASAAGGGHLEILQWLRNNPIICPWDESTCYEAAGGHLEILKWARANGCPWDKDICNIAMEKDNLEILRWAVENGCPIDEDMFVMFNIDYHGNQTQVYKWYLEEGRGLIRNRK